MFSKLKRNKWEKKCLQLFIFTLEKRKIESLVYVWCVITCKDNVWFYPKNRNWLTTLLLCLRYNGFKFITVMTLLFVRKLRQNFFMLVFWNTLTRFYYMLLYMFESFLTVSTTFRICPCVCKTRKGNRKKLVILDWCCPKNKMF